VGGVQGILPGYNVVNTLSTESNQTSDNQNETTVLTTANETMRIPDMVSDSNETQVTTGPLPNMDLPTDNQVANIGLPNGGHPWWWVDFEMQNETYLEEVDKHLYQVAEFHDFSIDVSLADIDALNVVSYTYCNNVVAVLNFVLNSSKTAAAVNQHQYNIPKHTQ
jgi:hypothetical protein